MRVMNKISSGSKSTYGGKHHLNPTVKMSSFWSSLHSIPNLARGVQTGEYTNMNKRSTKLTVIFWEIIGFATVILLLWVDEILDLPYHLLGTTATPINWVESLLETLFVIILGWIVIVRSKRTLRRIRYLEGFLPVCSFCNRICADGVWMPIHQYLDQQTGVRAFHRLCPECEKEKFG